MEEVEYSEIYRAYRAKYKQLDKKKCYDNLTNRLNLFRNDNKFSYIGLSNSKKEIVDSPLNTFCLCGQPIQYVHIFSNGTNDIMIGSQCIQRYDEIEGTNFYEIAIKAQRKYINDLKKSWCTECKDEYTDSHFKTTVHKNRFLKNLNNIIDKKLKSIGYENGDWKTVKKNYKGIQYKFCITEGCDYYTSKYPKCLYCWSKTRGITLSKYRIEQLDDLQCELDLIEPTKLKWQYGKDLCTRCNYNLSTENGCNYVFCDDCFERICEN